MKSTTKLIAVSLLIMVWCIATFYATNTMEILPFGNILEQYMVLCPFIALVGVLSMMVIEARDKAKSNARRN